MRRTRLERFEGTVAAPCCYPLSMPDGDAKIGDAYWVYPDATERPALTGNKVHPMACVAERPVDPTAWTALPRISSGIGKDDLRSRAMPEVHPERLDREGAWSLRWIHPVLKSVTGVPKRCEFIAVLPDDERNAVMDFYRNRQR